MVLDTDIRNRYQKKDDGDIVTVYELSINNTKTIKPFITMDRAQADIILLDATSENSEVTVTFKKFKTSRAAFVAHLRQLTECI